MYQVMCKASSEELSVWLDARNVDQEYYVLATWMHFNTRQEAEEYAKTIASVREPMIVIDRYYEAYRA